MLNEGTRKLFDEITPEAAKTVKKRRRMEEHSRSKEKRAQDSAGILSLGKLYTSLTF